ncbi:hypothetical protein [Clostridium sp.]
MKKEIWLEVEERSNGHCEFPGCENTYHCEKHHVYGKANRKRLEMPQTVFNLCWFHHQDHKIGVHHNLKNRLTLERMTRENLYAIGWDDERIAREVYGDSKGIGEIYLNRGK